MAVSIVCYVLMIRCTRSGVVGSAVQSALTKRGYYRGPIDGVIGASSRRAIRAFQANQGSPVTGLIDRKLISALQLGGE
jgi:peptidoglycan hydrolase-like protein with peptidoglycan-binding domain